MASKAMADRLAARTSAVVGDTAGDAGDTTSGGLGDDDEGTSTEHVTETPVAEVSAEPVPKAAAEAIAAVETPEEAEAKARAAARKLLFEEKLKGAREKNAARRAADQTKADRKAAAEERAAAAAEKAKYEGLKTGTFKETLTALGRDPRKIYEELQREAIEASTPEAQARREKEEAQKALDDRLNPLQQKLDAIEARNKQLEEQAEHTRVVTNFQRAAAAPEFKELRIEYPDEALYDHAQYLIKNPAIVYDAARKHQVRLTDPTKGFTMHELFQVMAAVQSAHDNGKQARRAALSPAEPQSAAPPTVNGTAPRRNAGLAIGNDLASQRVSAKAEDPSISPKERLRQRIATEVRRRD